MEGELHLDRRKKNHLGNKSLGAFWKETWVGPDQDAVVWPDLCSKQHRNMSFQKEILSPQFPLSPRNTMLVKMNLSVSYLFHLGSWAHQHFKPESKFNYLAYAFCGLKICRASWGYWVVNPSCACGVGPFPRGDWGAAMASQGVLAGVVLCGQLGCPASGLCGAGVGHLCLGKDCIHLSNYRK